MSTCDKNCSSCAENCKDRKENRTDFLEKPHEMSNVKKVIAIVSGKGGVGKSSITSMLAVTMNRLGYNTAILDADITGPSIPKAFNIKQKAVGNQMGILPVTTKTGIDVMSVNLILEQDTEPVLWRGPIIADAVKQFWSGVMWGDIDYMFIDMPPGTGDVPLTVFQSIPIDGIIVVTSPQELVSMIVTKAVKMAEMMNIPILGLVENMSYFTCPDNGKDYQIFGDSHIDEIANEYNLKVLAKLAIDPKIANACDNGSIEFYDGNNFEKIVNILENKEDINMIKIAIASEKDNVAEHFGHCSNFNIYEVEGNKVVGSESIPNPGHKPGFLPNFLNELGVNVVISGGMGGGAIEIFNQHSIEVIVGASGNLKDVIDSYTNGTLKSTGSICNKHEHAHECH